MSTGPQRHKQLARSVAKSATGEIVGDAPLTDGKDPATQALGKRSTENPCT